MVECTLIQRKKKKERNREREAEAGRERRKERGVFWGRLLFLSWPLVKSIS